MVGFLALNVLIFAAWHAWLARRSAGGDALVYAGLLAATQLVVVAVALGAAGLLRAELLVAAHLAVTGAVALAAWWSRHSVQVSPARPGLWRGRLREVSSPANIALAGLAAFLAAWMILAAYLLPPRGIDDLAYHLPPIFDAAQTGRLRLLDTQLRPQFAMPMAGNVLALWPLVFFHDVTWIDFVQFAVAGFGAVALGALARALGVARGDAFLVGLSFLFVPVVMGQAGSNYIDVTLAVCQFVLLYAVLRYWQEGTAWHLAMAGLAAGFGLGVKYNMLVMIALVQPLVLLRCWRDRSGSKAGRGYALATVAMLVVPGYWLARNAIVFGYPFYPYELGLTGLANVQGAMYDAGQQETGAISTGPAILRLFDSTALFLTFLLRDPGLGTLNGGFGAVFWGLGVPALAYCTYRAVHGALRRDFFPALFWGQALLMAIVYLMQTDAARIQFNQRLVIALAGFGLLALGAVLPELRARMPAAALAARAFAVIAAALATMQLAGSILPSFQLREPVTDRIRGRDTSPYRYHRQGSGDLPTQSVAWEALDFLTLPGPGWSVYLAAPWNVYFSAPAWGTRLQNRLWNLRPAGEPDALVFHFGLAPGWEQWYLGPPITPESARQDPALELVAQVPSTQLWVRQQRLAEPATRARLAEFYRRAYASDIEAARPLIPHLPSAGALVTSSPWGPALKYLSLAGEIPLPVHLAPAGHERRTARRLGAVVLTTDAPPPGSPGREIGQIVVRDTSIKFYINEL